MFGVFRGLFKEKEASGPLPAEQLERVRSLRAVAEGDDELAAVEALHTLHDMARDLGRDDVSQQLALELLARAAPAHRWKGGYGGVPEAMRPHVLAVLDAHDDGTDPFIKLDTVWLSPIRAACDPGQGQFIADEMRLMLEEAAYPRHKAACVALGLGRSTPGLATWFEDDARLPAYGAVLVAAGLHDQLVEMADKTGAPLLQRLLEPPAPPRSSQGRGQWTYGWLRTKRRLERRLLPPLGEERIAWSSAPAMAPGEGTLVRVCYGGAPERHDDLLYSGTVHLEGSLPDDAMLHRAYDQLRQRLIQVGRLEDLAPTNALGDTPVDLVQRALHEMATADLEAPDFPAAVHRSATRLTQVAGPWARSLRQAHQTAQETVDAELAEALRPIS